MRIRPVPPSRGLLPAGPLPARALLLFCVAAVALSGCAALRRDQRAVSEPPAAAAPAAAEARGTAAADPAERGGASQQAPLQAQRPGQEVVLAGCLRFSVLDFTNRSGPLDPADWATVRVENHCDEPVRYLLVDLLLLDVLGRTYGTPVWVLERGEVLWPGHGKTEHYTIPDPADHLPRQWAVRLRSVERPSDGPTRRASARR